MPASPTKDRRPLAERVRPGHLDEVLGNAAGVEALRAWARSWAGSGVPRRRAALLSGVPGVGKTSAATALANDMGWNLVELNASDARNQRAIDQVAGRASLSHSLSGFAGKRARGQSRVLILLDEADCLTGRATEGPSHKAAPASFREFLQGRYGSLEALAQAWGLGERGAPPRFQRWEAIPATPGRAGWVALRPAERDIRDWRGVSAPTDTSDRGGLSAIARLVRETRQPVVLTVNDDRPLTRYSPVFRSEVVRIRFHPVSEVDVRALVRRVAVQEGYTIGGKTLEAIVQRSEGDLRGALNDLEAVSVLPPGLAQETSVARRERTGEFAALTEEVLSEGRMYRSFEIRDRLDATPEDLFPWFEENLPRFARDAQSRWDGFQELSRAELMLSRARRYRVYGLWSYASESMTGGVAVTLGRGAPRIHREAIFPTILGEMARSRVTRGLRLGILAKIGHRDHLSRRKASEGSWGLIEGAFGRDQKRGRAGQVALQKALIQEYSLTPDEVAFLLASSPDSPEVAALISKPEVAARESRARPPPPEDAAPAGSDGVDRPPKPAAAKRRQRQLVDY